MSIYRSLSLSFLLVVVYWPSLSWIDVNVGVDIAVTVASVVCPIASVLIHLGVHEPEIVGGRGASPLGAG